MSTGPAIALPPAESLPALPVIPLKNTTLFPFLFLPLSVGRANSVAAVEAATASAEKSIVVVAQRDANQEQLGLGDLYRVGTLGVIRKMARTDGAMELLVQGTERVELVELVQSEPFLKARVRQVPLPTDQGAEVDALYRSILDLARKAVELTQPDPPISIDRLAADAGEPMRLVYLFGSMASLDTAKEQALLEAPTRLDALRLLHTYMSHELQVLELRHKIASTAQTEMTKQQRDYFLRQQMRAIQDELGEKSPESAEVEELRQRLQEADLPDDVRKEAERELSRLDRMSPAAPDYQLTRTYLELVTELPWKKRTEDELDLVRARRILDEDHFGLEDVKKRILEHLAVLKLNPQANAPILCFVGPPGVGKTSLGQSIARSLGRKFERLSLGGLHDEAELRGHRRTYIGAMPGRILQGIRRAGVKNPLLMLDEIDKLGRDFRGDPAAALLEILDPAQNGTFRDNYLDLPFDLSKVFFITTANTLDTIPRPLLDRMELLHLTGYSEEEKLEIAKRYLIPRQLAHAGLTAEQLVIPDETTKRVISGYTREAGVRQLERALGSVARRVALRFAEGTTTPVTVSPADLAALVGPERFFQEHARRELPPGVSTGLAWTEAGGEVLYIEAALMPDGPRLRLTGQLGKVMRESAKAAQTYLLANAGAFGIDRAKLNHVGVHIHVPAGAVPKDGPSAGVAMATALASLYTQKPVRSDLAMTGEITLSGLVLPVGGIKEKVLAARRAGIKHVLLPKANEKDLQDLPEHVRKELRFTFAERIEEALAPAIPELKVPAK